MKVLAILLVIVLAFSIVGCGKKKVRAVDEEAEREAAERAAAEAAKEKPALPEREREPVQPTRPDGERPHHDGEPQFRHTDRRALR